MDLLGMTEQTEEHPGRIESPESQAILPLCQLQLRGWSPAGLLVFSIWKTSDALQERGGLLPRAGIMSLDQR